MVHVDIYIKAEPVEQRTEKVFQMENTLHDYIHDKQLGIAVPDVYYMCLSISVKPILEPMHDRSVSEGRSIRVTCTLSDGDKPVKMLWLKDGRSVIGDGSNGITVTEHDYISIMTIDDVNYPRHDGNYTCVASNKAATVNHTVSVKVKGQCDGSLIKRTRTILPDHGPIFFFTVPPSWTVRPTDRQVSIGSQIQIPCQVKGHPTPQVKWSSIRGTLNVP